MDTRTLDHVYKRLTRMSGELHELLSQINPPALHPLPSGRDVPATPVDEATLTGFSAVLAAYEAVETARRAVSPLDKRARVSRTHTLRAILHERPQITRTEVLQLLGWDNTTLDQALDDLEQVANGQIAASA